MRSTTFTRIAKDAPFHDAGHGFDIFGLHPPTLASAAELARPIYDAYFRVDSAGSEHIPATGPAILVANHSGVLPVDAAMLCLDVLLRLGRASDDAQDPGAVAAAATEVRIALAQQIEAALAARAARKELFL